jgi:hypothetical protein
MPEAEMTFAEWVKFESARIVHMGFLAPAEHREAYMQANIEAALNKAFFHGKDGLTEIDPPRAVRQISN